MKKRKDLWFTIVSYVVERWLLPGYHVAKKPPKKADRRKAETEEGA